MHSSRCFPEIAINSYTALSTSGGKVALAAADAVFDVVAGA